MTTACAALGAIRIVLIGMAHGARPRIGYARTVDADARQIDSQRFSQIDMTRIARASLTEPIDEPTDQILAAFETLPMNVRADVDVIGAGDVLDGEARQPRDGAVVLDESKNRFRRDRGDNAPPARVNDREGA